jgi:hypothetical protein
MFFNCHVVNGCSRVFFNLQLFFNLAINIVVIYLGVQKLNCGKKVKFCPWCKSLFVTWQVHVLNHLMVKSMPPRNSLSVSP